MRLLSHPGSGLGVTVKAGSAFSLKIDSLPGRWWDRLPVLQTRAVEEPERPAAAQGMGALVPLLRWWAFLGIRGVALRWGRRRPPLLGVPACFPPQNCDYSVFSDSSTVNLVVFEMRSGWRVR